MNNKKSFVTDEITIKLYRLLKKHKSTISGILITFISTILFDCILNSSDEKSFLELILNIDELKVKLLYFALVVLATFVLNMRLWEWKMSKESYNKNFSNLMAKYTNDNLKSDKFDYGNIYWGEGKTFEYCNDIINGWPADSIIVDYYDSSQFSFKENFEEENRDNNKDYFFNNRDYLAFMDTDDFKRVIKQGNNLVRVMLVQCKKNYNKRDRKLLLRLQRTEWSQTSYVWDKFAKAYEGESGTNYLMKQYAKGITSGTDKEVLLPNSLCLHLIVETADNKIVLSKISQRKYNDNPGTWAATLGEQLELDDFCDGKDYYDDFVKRWVRRAFREEYKMSDLCYANMIDSDSIRVLSINFEADRYNFAMLCVVKTNYSFDVFNKKVGPVISTEEAIELKAIELDDIPAILFSYNDVNKRGEYHPSTYLRLLLYYMHKNGFERTENKLIYLDKTINN